jgi:sterol desaturase/sphingolipid hydroxylase (fatty acid hydroxylase superfamily)
MQDFFAELRYQIPEAAIVLLYAYALMLLSWPVFLVLEKLSPVHAPTPGSHFLYNWKVVLSNIVLTPVVLGLVVAATTSFGSSLGLPALPYPAIEFSVGIAGLDALAQGLALFVLACFLGDFSYYWWHRAQHEFPALWELHKLHHSDEHLNSTSIFRSHFLELSGQALVRGMSVGLVFDLAGMPQTALFIVAAGLLPPLWDIFIHANVRLGWLHRFLPFFSTPHYHWIHHSRLPQHQDKNYAIWLPVFDKVFGTYYGPSIDEYPPTGLSSGESAGSVLEEQIAPFAAWVRRVRGR